MGGVFDCENRGASEKVVSSRSMRMSAIHSHCTYFSASIEAIVDRSADQIPTLHRPQQIKPPPDFHHGCPTAK